MLRAGLNALGRLPGSRFTLAAAVGLLVVTSPAGAIAHAPPAGAIAHAPPAGAITRTPWTGAIARTPWTGAIAQTPRTGAIAQTPPTGGNPVTPPTAPNTVMPCSAARLHLRCPDLVMSAPFDLHVDRTSVAGHVLLRAASSVNNHGTGPMELRAHRRAGGPWVVDQVVYDVRGRRHLFATKVQLVFKFVRGYRYDNPAVGDYSYWKVQHVVAFELWSVDAHFRAVRLVRVGPKVDYCLRDLIRTRPSRRSPANPVYAGCSQNPRLRSDILGTSVGWSDVYPYEYPQQWIDVTGLHGRFAFVMIADPRDLLVESNKSNNISETYVELPSGRVLGHRVGVSAP